MLPILTPSDFVALTNQTLEFAYPSVIIEGEVLNFKISRGRWVYFDIADEFAKLRCFGTVYVLPAPIEDGMKLRVSAAPRLHPQFGFSLNVQAIELSGEGSIKKASDLLLQKLEKEGLFASERKRVLPYPPEKIGLITSEESAGYKDFIKVLGARYNGLEIVLANVQVQGEAAVGQIVNAIEWFNKQADMPDVLVLVRGGGSADDLQAFSTEQVTRAVAASRIPTMVAIGHEVDISLAELAADQRASTPSNAAELLVPDKCELKRGLERSAQELHTAAAGLFSQKREDIEAVKRVINDALFQRLQRMKEYLGSQARTLDALSPHAVLKRGYAVVRSGGKVIRRAASVRRGTMIDIQFDTGSSKAEVK